MLRIKSAGLCLIVSLMGCATSKPLKPLGNCAVSRGAVNPSALFSCVDEVGKSYKLPWEDTKTKDLICFDLQAFKEHEEACH